MRGARGARGGVGAPPQMGSPFAEGLTAGGASSQETRQTGGMLSPNQRAEFERWGVLKLDGVFSAGEAARMQAVAWGELNHRYGIEREDRSTWDRHPPTGMKTTKKSKAFAPILGPTVVDVLDELFGAD